LTLGDSVDDKKAKTFGFTPTDDSNINEVKSSAFKFDNVQPSDNTYKSNERSSNDNNNLDKYKNMQGVGSDMLGNNKVSEPK